MKQKKPSLQSIVDKTDWLMVEPNRLDWGLGENEVAVAFISSKPNLEPVKIDRVKIRIGSEVLLKLKWETGDNISVFHDPDHLLTFKLAKTVSGRGYKLSKESGTSIVNQIVFKWAHKIPLEKRKSRAVNYEIYKNNLIIFKIGSEEEIY